LNLEDGRKTEILSPGFVGRECFFALCQRAQELLKQIPGNGGPYEVLYLQQRVPVPSLFTRHNSEILNH
jgi:hypothetical protein